MLFVPDDGKVRKNETPPSSLITSSFDKDTVATEPRMDLKVMLEYIS